MLGIFNRYRVKTPTVLSMETAECGAASLCMVLGYYKRFVPLEQLRYECDVNRDGSSAKNILKAAALHGMECRAYSYEVEDFEDQEFPVIIHWKFNHFLVVEGFKKDKVYLNDPAVGHRVISIEEFSESFTGIVLDITPSDDFEKQGKKSNLLEGLKNRLGNYKKDIAFIIMLGLILVIPGIVIPIFSRIFVDNILINNMNDWLLPLIVGMLITAIFRGGVVYLKSYFLLKTQNKLDIETSAKYFWHVLRLPVSFFSQRYKGEIGSRILLNSKVADLITGKLANNFLDIIVIVFYFIVMLQYSVLLTLLGTALALINIVALRVISSKRAESYLNYSSESGKLMGVTLGGVQTIETLKAMGRENDFFMKWSGYFTKVVNEGQKLGVLTLTLNSIPVLIKSVTTIVILVIGAKQVMNGIITMGMLVAFQSLFESFSRPIDNLVKLGSDFQEAEGDMTRLDDVLKTPVDIQVTRELNIEDNNYDAITKKLEGYIEFKNVTFGYSNYSDPLINNLSFKIAPGEKIALVGGSGSGKSTIAKLLAGFYEPWSGEILFDGKPRSYWPRQVVNNSLSMVAQEFFLFNGTFRDILTIWDNTVPEQIIIKAAKDAQIHDIISSKTDAYDYEISEGGKNLSGGQKQRLEIARSLINNPSSLILDEATSALDSITEKQVLENIGKRKCSVLIVAHRLSTIRDCDEIIVLQKGQIAERGTHKELMKMKGSYAKLIEN